MAIPKPLERLLKDNKVKYQVIEHRKVFTAYDSAETQHMKMSEVAKAVLLKGSDLYLAVLPAGNNCDFKALAKLSSDKKLTIAKEKDITTKLKTKVGLVAPFGSLYKIPVFFDKKLTKNKKLNLPAGSYTESLVLSVKDYIKLENPVLGNFSIKK